VALVVPIRKEPCGVEDPSFIVLNWLRVVASGTTEGTEAHADHVRWVRLETRPREAESSRAWHESSTRE
jgi:hypothetical protein